MRLSAAGSPELPENRFNVMAVPCFLDGVPDRLIFHVQHAVLVPHFYRGDDARVEVAVGGGVRGDVSEASEKSVRIHQARFHCAARRGGLNHP